MRRGYLLPEGCKDIIDVLNMKEQQKFALSSLPAQFVPPKSIPKPTLLPGIKGELIIKTPVSVKDLAEQLGQMPFKIIADLMGIGIFASVSQHIAFETVCIIARQYGFLVKKAD